MLLTACAGLSSTPAQGLGYERWQGCGGSTVAQLDTVDPDGTIRFGYYLTPDRDRLLACLAAAGRGGQALPEPASRLIRGGP
jgi:hypothetical protein